MTITVIIIIFITTTIIVTTIVTIYNFYIGLESRLVGKEDPQKARGGDKELTIGYLYTVINAGIFSSVVVGVIIVKIWFFYLYVNFMF